MAGDRENLRKASQLLLKGEGLAPHPSTATAVPG
jgi:hypothetical protein